MVFIGLDKSGYQVNSFLISPRKHMLWVLGEALLVSTHNMFMWRNKKNIIFWGLKKSASTTAMVLLLI